MSTHILIKKRNFKRSYWEKLLPLFVYFLSRWRLVRLEVWRSSWRHFRTCAEPQTSFL